MPIIFWYLLLYYCSKPAEILGDTKNLVENKSYDIYWFRAGSMNIYWFRAGSMNISQNGWEQTAEHPGPVKSRWNLIFVLFWTKTTEIQIN
jgi:hypothetical protein